MRRLLLLAAVLMAAVLASEAQASVFGDTARGSGSAGPCVVAPAPGPCGPLLARNFNFLALGYPGGAIGLYTQVRSNGSRETGIVRCIEVVGNHAVIGGTMVATPTIPAGTKWSVWVIDNGPPGGVSPDLISPMNIYDVGAPDDPCATETFPLPPPFGYFPVTGGNIVVTDGSLLFP